jgi:hypothetical protein
MHMLVTIPLERRIELQHAGLGCSLLDREHSLFGNLQLHHCLVGETWWRTAQSRWSSSADDGSPHMAMMFVVIVIEHPSGSGDVAYMNEVVVVAKALTF